MRAHHVICTQYPRDVPTWYHVKVPDDAREYCMISRLSTRYTRNVSNCTIQSKSWINFSTNLHCAGFIKLVQVHQVNGERFIGLSGIPLQQLYPASKSRRNLSYENYEYQFITKKVKMVDKSHSHKRAIYCMSPRVLARAGHKFVQRTGPNRTRDIQLCPT